MTIKKNAEIASSLHDDWLSTSNTFETKSAKPKPRHPAPPAEDDWMIDSDDDEPFAAARPSTPAARVEPTSPKPARKTLPVVEDDDWLGNLDGHEKPRSRTSLKAAPLSETVASNPSGTLKFHRRPVLTHTLAALGGLFVGLTLAMLLRPATPPITPPSKDGQTQGSTQSTSLPSNGTTTPNPTPNPSRVEPPHRKPNPFGEPPPRPAEDSSKPGTTGIEGPPTISQAPKPEPPKASPSIGPLPAEINIEDYATPPPPPRLRTRS